MIDLDNTYVSLNQQDLNRQILCLHVYLHSAGKIQSFLIDYYGLSFKQAPSTRYIENIIQNAQSSSKVKEKLQEIDALVAPKASALIADELCSPSPYIFYTSTLAYSGYCLNLDIFSDHSRAKKAQWLQCYEALIKNGLNPITTTSDQGMGTMTGQIAAFKNAYFIADFFHLYNNFKTLKEQAQKESDRLQKEWDSIYHVRVADKPIASQAKTYDGLDDYYLDDEGTSFNYLENDYACLALAPDLLRHQLEIEQDLKIMNDITENIKTLLSWFTGYILTLSGDNIKDRVAIYDMIVEGLEDCAKLSMTKKCNDIAGSMRRQIEKLLNFLPFLDDQFEQMLNEYHQKNSDTQSNLTKEILWRINKYLHYAQDNQKGIDLAKSLKSIIGDDLFETMVNKIRHLHDTTITCSSYAENHISRLKPFVLNCAKALNQEKMDFLRLFLNTTNLHSSRDYNKSSRTPLQIMLGDQYDFRWIDLFYERPTLRQRGLIHPQMMPKAQDNAIAYIKAA